MRCSSRSRPPAVASDSIDVVGHRVVHGGEAFSVPTVIDGDMLVVLEGIADLAPLHNPVATATIRAARRRLPGIPHVADFDTAFHATLPVEARRYPVPDDWIADHGIRRFGFHGLSVEWSVARAAGTARTAGRRAPPRRRASRWGMLGHRRRPRSLVDTSMGLTPMEGLMMATRAGSIDPGIVFRLLRAGVDADRIERRLDHESGLHGVGGSADMRRLLQREGDGDERAALAIELFARRAAAGIAAAATALADLDALVFTGGIGEGAAVVRSRICERLGILGVPPAGDSDTDGEPSSPGARPARRSSWCTRARTSSSPTTRSRWSLPSGITRPPTPSFAPSPESQSPDRRVTYGPRAPVRTSPRRVRSATVAGRWQG